MQAFLQRAAPYTLSVLGDLTNVRQSNPLKEVRDVVK